MCFYDYNSISYIILNSLPSTLYILFKISKCGQRAAQRAVQSCITVENDWKVNLTINQRGIKHPFEQAHSWLPDQCCVFAYQCKITHAVLTSQSEFSLYRS